MKRHVLLILTVAVTLGLPTVAWALGAPGAGEGASPEPLAALLVLVGAVPAAWVFRRTRRSRIREG